MDTRYGDGLDTSDARQIAQHNARMTGMDKLTVVVDWTGGASKGRRGAPVAFRDCMWTDSPKHDVLWEIDRFTGHVQGWRLERGA